MANCPHLLLLCGALTLCATLSAQESTAQIDARFDGNSDLSVATESARITVAYILDGPAAGDATISNEINCTVEIVQQPADGETTAVVAVTPETAGPYSFNVSVPMQEGDTGEHEIVGEMVLHSDDYHCHTWGCHEHNHGHDHHCSTADGYSWMPVAILAAVAVMLMRRRQRS